jgi:glucosylceramidase
MNRARKSITGVGIAVLFAACRSGSSNTPSQQGGSGGSSVASSGGAAGNASGGSSGTSSGGASGTSNGGSSGTASGGSSGKTAGGTTGTGSGGKSSSGGATGTSSGGGGTSSVGAGGNAAGGSSSSGVTGGATGSGGAQVGGAIGAGGASATGGAATASTALVTSVTGNYWQTGTWTETTSGSATVTVNDTTTNQKWEGFGGAFNEMGWTALSSAALQTEAVTLLFSPTDGANFTMGRIPIGASDYATNRYTDDDGTWTDVDASSGTRQPADTSMANFSIDRDKKNLIPYVKAAIAIKSSIRFWASPWTPPVWMKTGYKTDKAGSMSGWKPSFYDGGNMSSDAATLTAYAQYYTKFVQGYKDQGINIELVSPQNEPGYDQNYPSCLWDGATYASWIGKYLGPAMQTLGVKVMLGTLSNADKDIATAQAATSDSTAKSFLSVVGVQWNVLDAVNSGQTFSGIPIWATEHKCGNYPWGGASGCGESSDSCPSYNSTQAPNDQAYGVESWKYIRNAITKGKVTSYSAWNMVLDKSGLGIDTSRDWKQDALLVADGGKVNPTPAYYVFRHLSQYVQPGASVVGTSGGDAVAFKNPDGSLVAVVYNSGAENKTFIVKIGGKMLQFDMPGDSKGAWATIKYGP